MNIIKLNELDAKNKNIKLFLYGDAMIGKTTLAATFPKPFIVSTDGNIKGLNQTDDGQAVILQGEYDKKLNNGQIIKESGWPKFKELVDAILRNDEIETVVIDVVKDIYKMARKFVLKKYGLIHESDDKQMGRIWTIIQDEFEPVLKKLLISDKNIVLIAHAKEHNSKTKPDLIDSVFNFVKKYVEIIGYLAPVNTNKGTERLLVLIPNPNFIVGNRLNIKNNVEQPTYEKIIKEI